MDEWTKRVKEKFENAPCIEEVLFGHSFAPYALKRLQYFALTHGIMLVFLLIEFRILLEMLGAKDFGFYFFLKAGLLFFSGFWWGGLEPFRAEVRELFRLRQSYKIPRVHRRWQAFPDALMGASLCAVAVMAMAFVVLGKPFSFVAILCLIGGISFALNLKVRWLHSGIYAVRRVYLSPWALVLSRAVLPILILGLHPVMGKWCLPLALLVAEVAQVTIQLSFIRKSYQNLRLDYPGFLKFPKAWAGWRQAFFLLKNEEFRWAGLSQGLTRLDFAVVGFVFLFLALKGAGDQVEESLRLAILVAPFLVVCSEWGRLFYFDFKKLEIDSLQGFRERFERQVEGLAFWVAGVCGLLFFLVHRWLIGPLDSLSGFVFLGLFFSVSLFSYQQIQTFSAGHYRKLVSAALMVILGALVFAGMGDSWGVVAFSLGVLWAVRRLRAEEKGGARCSQRGDGEDSDFPRMVAECSSDRRAAGDGFGHHWGRFESW